MLLARLARAVRIQPAMHDLELAVAFHAPEVLFRFEQPARVPAQRLIAAAPALHVGRHALDRRDARLDRVRRRQRVPQQPAHPQAMHRQRFFQPFFQTARRTRIRALQLSEEFLRLGLGPGVIRHGIEEHHACFEKFCEGGNGALAEAVSEITTSQGEKGEGGSEEETDQRFEAVTAPFIGFKREDEVDDEKFQGIFVERALKLRGHEAPKAQAPLAMRRGRGEVEVSGHSEHPRNGVEVTKIERV